MQLKGKGYNTGLKKKKQNPVTYCLQVMQLKHKGTVRLKVNKNKKYSNIESKFKN